jgi:hypothetical protein
MWEPVGPLPATVYWRRRWTAVASAAAAVLVLAWTAGAFASPHDAETATIRASRAALNAPPSPSPSPAPVPAAAPASTDPATSPPSPSMPVAATPTRPGAGTPAPATTSEELRPDETTTRSVPPATPVTVPPTGPVPCTNAMLAVGAEIDRPQHRVGDRPLLRLVITNTSSQPCVRDLDSARQEIVVWNSDQSAKLWSSNDCTNASSADLRTLVPGQPVTFSVTWAGRTSTPGCAQPRTVVPAGSYRVLTRLDDVISPPTPFLLTP